jgi:hypothetical protein
MLVPGMAGKNLAQYATNLIAGAFGGVTGETAAQAAPDAWKPVAGTTGALAGGVGAYGMLQLGAKALQFLAWEEQLAKERHDHRMLWEIKAYRNRHMTKKPKQDTKPPEPPPRIA